MFEIDPTALTLAQEGAPPLPLPPAEDGPVETADGATPAGGGGGSPPAFNALLYMMMLVLLAMIVFSFLGQRRERKRRQTLLAGIKKHDRVQTKGGVIGSIVDLKPDTVVLKVDETSNTRITFARSAIEHILSSAPESAPSAGKAD
jgi:preprotein translocase subunit YajC